MGIFFRCVCVSLFNIENEKLLPHSRSNYCHLVLRTCLAYSWRKYVKQAVKDRQTGNQESPTKGNANQARRNDCGISIQSATLTYILACKNRTPLLQDRATLCGGLPALVFLSTLATKHN